MAAIASSLLPVAEAIAQPARPAPHSITIPAQPLTTAIAELSRQAGVSIGTEGDLPGVRSHAVHGATNAADALAQMLDGTGLTARRVGPTAWRIMRQAAPLSPPSPPRTPVPQGLPPEPEAEPIIVTAVKDRSTLADVPRAVSVYLPDAMRQQDARSGTGNVAAALEGMAMTGSGPGRNQLFLRGVADSPFTGLGQSTVAVLLDGVRLTYSAPDPDVRLVDVERVEVLKGPQGSLYGTGTLGGIFQIVTKRPDASDFRAAASGGLSLVADGGSGYSGSAMVNLPLVRDSIALRLVGYTAREGGWVDTGTRPNANLVRTIGGRASLGVELGAGWRLNATGAVQRLEAADTQYVYAPGAHSRPTQQAEPHDNDLNHGAFRLEGRLGATDLVLLTGLSGHEVQDRRDAGNFGGTGPAIFDESRKYRTWDSELHLSGPLGALHWLAGLSYVQARQTIGRSLVSASQVTPLLDDNEQRKSVDSAVFANLVWPLGTGLSIEGGGRLFRDVIEDRRTTGGQSFARDVRRTGITPSAALSWKPRAGRMLYLRYGSAFRQGGIGLTAAGQAEAVSGDELATIEAGWRAQLAHGGSLDLNLYHTMWDEVQSDMPLPNGLIETRNVGRARIRGMEASLDLPLARHWHISTGLAVQDAQLIRNETGMVLDDRRLPVVPEYTLRFALKRRFELGDADGSLRLGLRYVGPARLSFDPVIDQPMGNYVESNLEVRLKAAGFEWGVDASNLLNGRRDTFALGNPLRLATTRQYTPQRPPMVSFSVLKQF